jgi:benzoate/toluate 1,2-dioxygenase reductase subunit
MVFQTSPGDPEVICQLKTRGSTYTAVLLRRRWLSDKSFEITLSLPPRFEFQPGQRVCLSLGEQERDYSIVSAPGESELALCIRKVAGGRVSTLLSVVDIGSSLLISGPYGYFTYKPSPRPTVFIANGTGIAPFCSMARSGISGFTLLHGVSMTDDLYYMSLFEQAAKKYVPCLTKARKLPANAFGGNVAEYLQRHVESKAYDFYLCGRREMIRDVTLLIDERFPESLVYTEVFY